MCISKNKPVYILSRPQSHPAGVLLACCLAAMVVIFLVMSYLDELGVFSP